MTAVTGLRRLPLVEPAPGDAPTASPSRTDRSVRTGRVSASGPAPSPVDDTDTGTDGGADAGGERAAGPALPAGAPGPGPAARRAGRWTRPTLVLPVVAVLLAGAVAVFVAGGGERGPGPGEAIVTLDGRAAVTRSDGATETVTDQVRLGPGDRLDVERGTATFELAGDVSFEGLAAQGATPSTSVEMALAPRLRSGRLLVDAPREISLRAGSDEITVPAGSAARLARTYALGIGVYRGTAEVDSSGVQATVAARRSVDVAAAGEVGAPVPIDVNPDDRWDRRYLGPAIALDSQLAPLAASMRASRLDGRSLVTEVRAQLDAPPSAGALDRLLAGRTVTLDQAIGVAVVGNGTVGTFAQRWSGGTAFHDVGASWGLVAMEVQADAATVAGDLRAALDAGVSVETAIVPVDGRTDSAEDRADGPATPDESDAAGQPSDDAGVATDPGAVEVPAGSSSDPGADTPDQPGGSPASPPVDAPVVDAPPTPAAPPVTLPPVPTRPPVSLPPVSLPPVSLPPVSLPVVPGLVETVDEVTGGVVTGLLDPVTGLVVEVLPILGSEPRSGSGGGGLLGLGL